MTGSCELPCLSLLGTEPQSSTRQQVRHLPSPLSQLSVPSGGFCVMSVHNTPAECQSAASLSTLGVSLRSGLHKAVDTCSFLCGKMYFHLLSLLAAVNVVSHRWTPCVYAANVDGRECPECPRWITQHPLRAAGWGVRAASLAGVKAGSKCCGPVCSPQSLLIAVMSSAFNRFFKFS